MEALVEYQQSPRKHNVSIMERKTLQELQSNPKIIIKQSDKDGSIIVMNTTDYVKEAMRQLSNTIFYQVLSSNPTERFVNERNCILDDALTNKWITEKQFDFLKNDFLQLQYSTFYLRSTSLDQPSGETYYFQ